MDNRDEIINVEPREYRRTQVRSSNAWTDGAYASHREVRQERSVWRAYHTVWLIVGIIEALLGFRFLFLLLAANPASGFTQLIYGLSAPFVAPFQSIFGVTAAGGAVFDWSLLVAAIVYLLIGYAVVQLLRIIRPVRTDEMNQTVVVR